MSTHDVYLDDSGTKEFADTTVNLFCYSGIVLESALVAIVENQLKALKQRYFRGNMPEIKSHWLRRPEKRRDHYLIKYDLRERSLSEFTGALYAYLNSIPLHVLGVVIDKQRLKNAYSKAHFYPSGVCYEFLLQRLANYSTQYSIESMRIFMDDMSGKTPRGKEWKKLLVAQHRSLLAGNSPFYRNWSTRNGMNYAMINSRLTFVDSAHSELIQVADLCAYNLLRQARESWNNFDEEPFYQGYKWILGIMHRDPKSGRINKYGAVCFPSQ